MSALQRIPKCVVKFSLTRGHSSWVWRRSIVSKVRWSMWSLLSTSRPIMVEKRVTSPPASPEPCVRLPPHTAPHCKIPRIDTLNESNKSTKICDKCGKQGAKIGYTCPEKIRTPFQEAEKMGSEIVVKIEGERQVFGHNALWQKS